MERTTIKSDFHFSERRKIQKYSNDTLVTESPLFDDESFGLKIQANTSSLVLADWYQANQSKIDNKLTSKGAILLRGFSLPGESGFNEILGLCGRPMEYLYRSTPRSRCSGNVYTSTEYPQSEFIPLHNENAYAAKYPGKVIFHCSLPASQGGATPIADSRKIYQSMTRSIREKFEKLGVRYVRNLGNGFDLDLKTVFQTEDKLAIDKLCEEWGIQTIWHSAKQLRTTQVLPAVRQHPLTNDIVWFNQAHLFHYSSLPTDVGEELIAAFGFEGLPRNAYYGDGSAIEETVINEISKIYKQHQESFDWQSGDVLILDNLLAAHGREPFEGQRRVVVGMTS